MAYPHQSTQERVSSRRLRIYDLQRQEGDGGYARGRTVSSSCGTKHCATEIESSLVAVRRLPFDLRAADASDEG